MPMLSVYISLHLSFLGIAVESLIFVMVCLNGLKYMLRCRSILMKATVWVCLVANSIRSVWQVSQERDGKTVDGKCHSLTATHIRLRHKNDPSIPTCGFYEVFIFSNLTFTVVCCVWNLCPRLNFEFNIAVVSYWWHRGQLSLVIYLSVDNKRCTEYQWQLGRTRHTAWCIDSMRPCIIQWCLAEGYGGSK